MGPESVPSSFPGFIDDLGVRYPPEGSAASNGKEALGGVVKDDC